MSAWNIWLTLDQCSTPATILENTQKFPVDFIPLESPKIPSRDWYIPTSVSSSDSIKILEIDREVFITEAWNSKLIKGQLQFSDKVIQIDNRSEHVLYVTNVVSAYRVKSDILDIISDYAKSVKSYSYCAGNLEVFDLLDMSKNSNIDCKWVT